MPDDPLQHAANLHRRWTGVGLLLFVAFYSLFFAAHLKFEKSLLYLKDDVVLSAGTATFYNDMAAPTAQAGSAGTGKGTAFLLLHHPVARLLISAWVPFSENQISARRHGVATLTACAAALTVVFLYLALLWSGVGRLRAALFAGVFGFSTSGLMFSVLPQPYIFGALGFMAALAAVARGRSGRWWEFAVAALYTACCAFWHVIPLLLLALVRGVRVSSRSDVQPILQAFVSVVLLAVAALGAIKVQGLLYPRTADVDAATMLAEMKEGLAHAGGTTTKVKWGEKVQDVLFANVAAPALSEAPGGDVPLSDVAVQAGPVEKASNPGRPWFLPDLQYAIWAVWLALLLAALLGMPPALRNEDGALCAVLVAAWFVWLDGVRATEDARLLHSVLWTPAIILAAGVGVEQHVDRWPWLRWPVLGLLIAFLSLEALRNLAFVEEIAQRVAL